MTRLLAAGEYLPDGVVEGFIRHVVGRVVRPPITQGFVPFDSQCSSLKSNCWAYLNPSAFEKWCLLPVSSDYSAYLELFVYRHRA
jgi:hypothetical protein